MSPFSTLLRYDYFFQHCCVLSTILTLLCYDNLFHDAPLCLFFTLLCYVYFLHAAVLWLPLPRCSTMSSFPTLLRYVYSFSMMLHYHSLFHAAAIWLLFKRCCAMSTFSMMLHYDYFFHAAALWLLFPRCCAMSTFYTLLCYDYLFHDAPQCPLFPRCCALSTFSTLMRHVSFFPCYLTMSTLSMLLYYFFFFFYDAALCLPLLWCSTLTNFSTLLRYDYFPRSPTMSTFSMMLHYVFFLRCCALSTVSILLLRYVYFFHAAALCLLFPRCSTKTTFMRWSRYFRRGGGGRGGTGQSDKKSFDNAFSFSLVLILFYKSQMFNFKENYNVSRFWRGSNFFQGGGPIALYRTPCFLWFFRGVQKPLPPTPSGSAFDFFHFSHAAVVCLLFHAAPPPPPPMTIPRSAHTCTILQFIVYFYHFLVRLYGRKFDYWHTNRVGSAFLSAAHTFYVTPTSQRAFALAFMPPFSTVFYVTPAQNTRAYRRDNPSLGQYRICNQG